MHVLDRGQQPKQLQGKLKALHSTEGARKPSDVLLRRATSNFQLTDSSV